MDKNCITLVMRGFSTEAVVTEHESSEDSENLVKFIASIDYFEKLYGRAADGNDQKAVTNFKTFESKEKLRRLQMELQWVKNGKVAETVCNQVIGKKRKAKYQSYNHWAELMLLWIAAKRGA
jgi:hypothetical protein